MPSRVCCGHCCFVLNGNTWLWGSEIKWSEPIASTLRTKPFWGAGVRQPCRSLGRWSTPEPTAAALPFERMEWCAAVYTAQINTSPVFFPFQGKDGVVWKENLNRHSPPVGHWVTSDYICSARPPITVVFNTAFLTPLGGGDSQHF